MNQKYYLMGAYILHNVPYDYIEFPKSNHGMYNDPDKLLEFLEKSLEYAERYFTDWSAWAEEELCQFDTIPPRPF